MNKLILEIILLSLITSLSVDAHQSKENSFEVVNYEIIKSENHFVIDFSIRAKVKGRYFIRIKAPSAMQINDNPLLDSSQNMLINQSVSKAWNFSIPRSGKYFIPIEIVVRPDNYESNYSYYSVRTLYFEVIDSTITKSHFNIDSNDYKMPIITMGETRPIILEYHKSEKVNMVLQTPITVQISGNIGYNNSNHNRFYGVPVRVWLDWDYDDNSNTGYTPYFWSNNNEQDRHIGWDDADMDGNFSFSFTFNSNLDANRIADNIRIYASNGNLACSAYSGQIIPTIFPTLNISQATNLVQFTDEEVFTVENMGAAIRNLTKAWIFTKEKFNVTLDPILFRIIDDDGPKAYYTPSIFQITFDDYYPDAGVSFHEYGHYSHHRADDDFPSGFCPSSHWFTKETNDDCANGKEYQNCLHFECLNYYSEFGYTQLISFDFKKGVGIVKIEAEMRDASMNKVESLSYLEELVSYTVK